ncbi:hypothetical protein [Sphingomonas koreensis]|uniref:hypothetical protein n=1 Tax=Sphingomonas koreensis TaxID=93064 RepID=UPI000F7F6BC6|nr:hypothetical protein [Sphingomonas koreensis]RSU21195.1 hypothetical protein CA224_06740 [Sphingomonas koreensis]RSU32240.1 hypothetical protein CA225_02745 [Sphingomonas koreensis]RSU35734.1 hypothetical protein BRX39_08915 [Sphingomonas koreensis]RSU49905.1 hypothetical protein CA221_12535 [Sphingomonas koreensis]RSU83502.1 hypothetical protein CA253_21395 [Sphingomonas koreensis]
MPTEPTILEEGAKIASAGVGVGGGFFALRWLVGWLTGRMDRRQEVLDAQEGSIDQEWKDLREELKRDNADLKRRMDSVETQNSALRRAFNHVAGALIRIDPLNAALAQADQMLTQAFPLDFSLTTERAEAALNATDPARRAE